jgi:Ca2+-binding EF-hand superfamily protein
MVNENARRTSLFGPSPAELSVREEVNEPGPEEEANLRRIFEQLDTNGNGRISADELLVVLKALKPSSTLGHAQTFISEADADDSGDVDWDEFKTAMRERITRVTTAERMFHIIDANHNGLLTPDEVRDAAARYGMMVSDEELDEMIRSVDRDLDGMVGLEEFSSALRPRRRTSVRASPPPPDIASVRRGSSRMAGGMPGAHPGLVGAPGP